MITCYCVEQGLRPVVVPAGEPLPECPWVDLLDPSPEEEAAVEAALGIDVRPREEAQEIEASSRFYTEDGGLFMTASVLVGTDRPYPELSTITFILTQQVLVTVRYEDSRAVRAWARRAEREPGLALRAQSILLGLLEAIVDRSADVLEEVGARVEALTRGIFADTSPPGGGGRSGPGMRERSLSEVLRDVGRQGAIASRVHESLVSLARVLGFTGAAAERMPLDAHERRRLKTLARDIRSLTEHVGFLSGRIAFLLDATLGLINIEQNAIIKIFSVAAVVFLPPTLVASIYGMNFRHMPELDWPFGYPLALLVMVLSALLPWLFFKRKGWL